MNLQDLKTLYLHELVDLYSAEKQLCEHLPMVIEKAADKKLKAKLHDTLEETKLQAKRIEKIMADHKKNPNGHVCKGMKGIIEESKQVMNDVENDEVSDAAIISMCNRMEHYEMAGYGTARAFAEQLGLKEDADLLLTSLNEESKADQRINTLAWRKVNAEAQHAQ